MKVHFRDEPGTPANQLAPFNGVLVGGRKLKAITPSELGSLRTGDQVYVESTYNYWKWNPTSTEADDTAIELTVCAPTAVGAGPGRFLRIVGVGAPEVMSQTTWVFSTAGNNENSGVDAANALRTPNERRRRMGARPKWRGVAYHLRYLSDGFSECIDLGECSANTTIYLHASMTDGAGAATLLAGTLTAVTAQNPATNIPHSSTSANVPASWTASGLIDKRIRLTSGANVKALSWVSKDLGGAAPNAAARFIEFLTPVASFNVAPFVAPGIARVQPASGDTFVVESLRVLTSLELDGSMTPSIPTLSGPWTVVLDGISTTIANNSNANFYADGCTISTVQAGGVQNCEYLHSCQLITTISDSSLKLIKGGYSLSNLALTVAVGLAASSIDLFTTQGSRQVSLQSLGHADTSYSYFAFGEWAVFDCTSIPILIASSGIFCRVVANQLWGSGNTNAIVLVAPGCTLVQQNSNAFNSWKVVTSCPYHFVFGPDYGISAARTRSSCPAIDNSVNPPVYTANRVLSLTNINALVSAGGFANNFGGVNQTYIQDILTGAGIAGN